MGTTMLTAAWLVAVCCGLLAIAAAVTVLRGPATAAAWQRWCLRRRWPLSRQVYHLRTLLQGDDRWLAHSPIADALTGRYLAALSDDWYTRSFESSDQLRRRLGLDPHGRGAEVLWGPLKTFAIEVSMGAIPDENVRARALSAIRAFDRGDHEPRPEPDTIAVGDTTIDLRQPWTLPGGRP